MKWAGEDGLYKFTIEEKKDAFDDTLFDVTIEYLNNKDYFWFRSYSSARNHLNKEYSFTGRMKKIK